jgi:hypothetical protein
VGGHTVGGRRQPEKLVKTAGVSHGRTLQASLRVCHGYIRVGKDPTGRICDRSANNPGGSYALRVGQGHPQQPGRE